MRFAAALILFLIGAPLWAQESAEPTSAAANIKTHYEPEGQIFVGQTVRLWVEITTPGTVSTPPQYPELKVDGAISLLPEQLGVNFTDRETGNAGLSQRYVIIPQRPGQMDVPSFQVSIGITRDGTEQPLTLDVTPAPIDVVLPDGVEGLDRVVTTSDMTVTEKYDQEATGLKVGDALERQVTIVAGGTFALALPEVTFEQVEGTKIYPAQPQLSDQTNRGSYEATRIDAATYVFQKAGAVQLPEIKVSWFDPEKKAVQETVLPALDIEVAPNPAYEAQQKALEAEQKRTDILQQIAAVLLWIKTHIALITTLAVVAYFLRLAVKRFGPVVLREWKDARERAEKSEGRAFKNFTTAARSGDGEKMRTAFWSWLNHFSAADTTATFANLAQGLDPSDRAQMEKFLAGSGSDAGSADGFRTSVTALRKVLLAKENKPTALQKGGLNPRGAAR
ncbi:MAG: hypothetical protein ACSHXD_08905 [Marinosulfonomonas sp.]